MVTRSQLENNDIPLSREHEQLADIRGYPFKKLFSTILQHLYENYYISYNNLQVCHKLFIYIRYNIRNCVILREFMGYRNE